METLSSQTKKIMKKMESIKSKVKHEKDQSALMQKADELNILKSENRKKRSELRKKKVRL